MYREAMASLIKWKASKRRKPLVIYGARQVGKTWLMETFGREHYAKTAYILMAENSRMANLFEGTTSAKTIISGFEAEVGFSINPDNTLIILDEVQEVPKALAALKYLFEQLPQYHIVVAGSMLGVALHAGVSFPVGKVDSLTIHPMNFNEFLRAVGSEQLAKVLIQHDQALLSSFHETLNDYLKQYLLVGGMPEVVQSFVDNHDYIQTRYIQKQILDNYDRDFGKHAPIAIVPRIRMAFSSIPSQLAKENKKFIYSTIKKGARAKEFELAIQWLVDAGLVHKVRRVNAANVPLKHYEDAGAFKLFLVDVGLQCAMANIEPKIILTENSLLTEFKGAVTEQYVAQQFLAKEVPTFYYSSDDSKIELDFIIQLGGIAIPVEVKSATNLQSKSLTHFVNKRFIKRAVKFSLLREKHNDIIFNEPLFLVCQIEQIVAGASE